MLFRFLLLQFLQETLGIPNVLKFLKELVFNKFLKSISFYRFKKGLQKLKKSLKIRLRVHLGMDLFQPIVKNFAQKFLAALPSSFVRCRDRNSSLTYKIQNWC